MAQYGDPDSTATRNEVHAIASRAVQARDIYGGVHMYRSSPLKPPIPRQLPPEPTHFTGRSCELDQLDSLLHREGSEGRSIATASAITGSAGIGKTSLAVRWAHRVQDRFPDGQLYINLRGYGLGTPKPTDRVLKFFLSSLGLSTEYMSQDIDTMVGMYRSLLAGRKLLVILDNAATSEQVRPLLPNVAGCVGLVTSRNRLSGLVARDGACRFTLNLLTSDEATSLIRQIIGRHRTDSDPDAVEQLARQCAYLPLALRVAAEHVAANPYTTIGDLVSELTAESGRLDILANDEDSTAVRTVFSWSYNALPSETARVFRLLGLHPGHTISVNAASALTGLAQTHTRRQLEALAAVHLVANTARDCYQFHDLLRVYAAECSANDEPLEQRDAATRRLFEWYLHTSHAALFAFYPQHPEIPVDPIPADCQPLDFTDRLHAANWFTDEHANLVAVIRRARRVGQYAVGWQLPNAVDCYLSDGHHVADQIAVHQLGLAAAQHLGNQLAERWAYGHLGEAYQSARRYDEAMECHYRSLEISREIGHEFGEAAELGDLAYVHHTLGRYQEAVDFSVQALHITRRIGHKRNEALNLVNLGNALRGLRQFDQALVQLGQSLNVAGLIDAHGIQACALRGMAKVHRELSQNDEAVYLFLEAVSLYGQGGMHHARAETLIELGEALAELGRSREACEVWKEAREILKDLDPELANEADGRFDAFSSAPNADQRPEQYQTRIYDSLH